MKLRLWIPCLALLVLPACAGAPKKNSWDNLDYGSVARRAQENDYNYVQPTVTSCVDDDLYNCNK